jgi:hypothetical protein
VAVSALEVGALEVTVPATDLTAYEAEGHLWRWRPGRGPLHRAACACWRRPAGEPAPEPQPDLDWRVTMLAQTRPLLGWRWWAR